MKLTIFILALLVASVAADCYLHNPRGSNNRLNEQNANRDNANRMFDSQNNNRGGYNTCDKARDAGDAAADNAANLRLAPNVIYGDNQDVDQAVQYPMMFYEGSGIQMEWTVQHGCGGNEATDPTKLNCNMVIQYMCDSEVKPVKGYFTDLSLTTKLADGGNTDDHATVNCQNDGDQTAAVEAAEAASDAAGNGRHENQAWYCECQQRSRNKGLFNADQNLNGDEAIYTRQNANGNRRGLECAEERDYYPYWAPSPWRDMAYLTDDLSRCEMIQTESQNVKTKWKCAQYNENNNGNKQILDKATTEPLNGQDCAAAQGLWLEYPAWGGSPPECKLGSYSRVNHLGNGRGDGVSPTTVNYNATLPAFELIVNSNTPTTDVVKGTVQQDEYIKCAMRVRYNVSTDDYDPWNTFADLNGAGNSPVTQNPNVAVGASANLQLALNTDQYGRTFQDRSHTFYLKKQSPELAQAVAAGAQIHNLNVRGKRGNVVETYPATEYDFVPTNLEVATGDFVHMQWCGSLTHDNGNPAGDGQAGNAGEGAGGTDKHNLVQMRDFDSNFPAPLEQLKALNIKSIFGDENKCYGAKDAPTAANVINHMDCALRAATNGLYLNTGMDNPGEELNETLDNTPAGSRRGGIMTQINAPKDTRYVYMATRNNNFTNRGQKGVTTVVRGPVAAPVVAPPAL